MKILILTGWGWKDYACAAALALRHHKQAEVMGISQRRLPEFLSEATGYGEIVILGVGLDGNPKLLEAALEDLAASKTKVVWMSSLPVAKSIGKGIRSRLELLVDTDAEGITDVVSRAYHIPGSDLAQILQEEKPTAKAQKVHLLLDAAQYMYRNYQDETAYAAAIRHIAHGDDDSQWTPAERKMVAHSCGLAAGNWSGKARSSRNC